MSGAKKMVPKRRFKEFLNAGDWELRKLGDVSNIIVGGTPSTKVKVYWEPKEVPWMSSGEINKKRIYSTDNMISEYGLNNSNARWVKANSVLIALAGQGKTRGTVAINDIPLTTNQSIAAMELNKDFDAEFIFQNLNSRYEELRRVSSGDGTRGGLNKEILSNFVVPYSIIDEQVEVGNFFRTIDNLIIRCQCKLDKLEATKKALLQEMFPEEGQDIPKRRFKGFTDAWEQRKLGECMDSFEYGLNAAAKEYDGMHKYIRITDIDDETHNFIQNNLTSPDIDFNSDVSDYKLNINDIVFARTGASVGKTYLYNPNDGDLYYAGFLIRGKVNEACDAGFVYQNTLTGDYDSFIRITSQRSGQPGVNSKEYATFRLNIPCKGEQEKISKLLSSLDKLFTLHQRKLDKLKNLKQAYLNEMFV